jgi:hypothetical protein
VTFACTNDLLHVCIAAKLSALGGVAPIFSSAIPLFFFFFLTLKSTYACNEDSC